MIRIRTLSLAALLVAAGAFAQGHTDYTLEAGKVRFHVPPDWMAIMQKSDGDPQAVIFQVPDPTAGSEATASVTVKTRALKNQTGFAAAVQNEFDLSKAQPGYQNDASSTDSAVHQYFVKRGKTRYLVRDRFLLIGGAAVQVRCQRPLTETTPKTWSADFDGACNQVAASLQQQ